MDSRITKSNPILPKEWLNLLSILDINSSTYEIPLIIGGHYPTTISLNTSKNTLMIQCNVFQLTSTLDSYLDFLYPVILKLNHQTLLEAGFHFGLDEFGTLKIFQCINLTELQETHIQTRLISIADKANEMDLAISKIMKGK